MRRRTEFDGGLISVEAPKKGGGDHDHDHDHGDMDF
jgi:hypothetical protein